MSEPIQMEVTFDSARPLKDKSVKVGFTTTKEITPDEFVELFKRLNTTGWVAYGPNELQSADIPDIPAEDAFGKKTQSELLRSSLWIVWSKTTDQAEPFRESWYPKQMARIRRNVLSVLDEDPDSEFEDEGEDA